jgi:hypothetical protein
MSERLPAPYCVSNIHLPPAGATVHGTYVNGGDVWYCDTCAETASALGLFTPRHVRVPAQHAPEQELADDYERNDHQ